MNRLVKHLRARRYQRDLQQEIQAHLDEKADDLIDAGLDPAQARRQTLQEFGNRTRFSELCHDQSPFLSLDQLAQDLRYALRTLRRTPAFAAVAIISLALGVGANTVVFSAVHHVLLRALPYPEPSHLFAVEGRSSHHGAERMHTSPADFYDWQTQSRSFQSLAAFASWPMNLTNIDEPRRLETQLVSANLFNTLGVSAQLGRTLLPGEDREQSTPVVVLSHHLWRELGESPRIVGSQLTLNGTAATVVGVMPAGFAFPSPETGAWVPLSLSAANRANREGRWLSVIGRLRPDTTVRQGATELDVIARRLASAYPASNAGWSAALIPLKSKTNSSAGLDPSCSRSRPDLYCCCSSPAPIWPVSNSQRLPPALTKSDSALPWAPAAIASFAN